MNFIETICNSNRLLLGGHRGHLSDVRENTIANFDQILPLGVDYIEIDIQLTRDDQAVIFHDRTLPNDSGLSGKIRDWTVQQLKNAFDLCTLPEALAWCRTNQMSALLEIKQITAECEPAGTILASRVIEAIHRAEFQQNCIVFGIDQPILRQIRSAAPDIPLGVIVPEPPADPVALMKDLGTVMYLSYLKDLTSEAVETLHRAGYIVDGSVVNNFEMLDLALSLRVDMIESDYPDRIKAKISGVSLN